MINADGGGERTERRCRTAMARPVQLRLAVLRRILGAIMVFGLVALPPAQGDTASAPIFMNGTKLQRQCSHGTGDESFCRGFVAGVADVLSGGDAIDGHRACAPLVAQLDDMVEIVGSWLEAHSRDGHRDAVPLVAAALAEAFPCD